MLPPLTLALWLGAPLQRSGTVLFCSCCLLGLATELFGTNVFHQWMHTPKPSIVVRWLQRGGLILMPERYQRHHCDHRRGFCVTDAHGFTACGHHGPADPVSR